MALVGVGVFLGGAGVFTFIVVLLFLGCLLLVFGFLKPDVF